MLKYSCSFPAIFYCLFWYSSALAFILLIFGKAYAIDAIKKGRWRMLKLKMDSNA